jgi:signal transduction histidine kinase/CheY-like chemotaxis protein
MGTTLLALVVHFALEKFLGPSHVFAFFGFAVAISAFCGGLGPGLAAAGLSLIAATFYFIEPTGSLWVTDPKEWTTIIVAASTWAFLVFLCDLLRSTAINYRRALLERDQLRDRLKVVLDSLSDPFFIIDRHQNVTYANEALLGLLRTTALSQGVPKLAELFQQEPAFSVLSDRLAEACRSGQSFTCDLEFGATWLHARAFSLPEGVAVTVQDITLRKTIEDRTARLLAEEREARAESERVGRLKDEFIATLSHELRTPLTAILGWSEMLLPRATTDPRLTEGLAAIDRAARTQTRLIEELLDMSRIAGGKLALEMEFLPLEEVVFETAESFRKAFERRNCELSVEVPPEPVVIRADPSRLQQIIGNLLDNALKFTPSGGQVRLTVAIARGADATELAEFKVSDNGEGIEPEFLPHLFEQFRQANSSSTRKYGGLGLGLAIAKQLAELHGGSISATSPGRGMGSTFVVRFPLVHFQPSLEPETDRAAVDSNELEGVRVLLVEDDEASRLILSEMLVACGATVTEAESASQALARLGAEPIDVLVTDLAMPEMDGMTLVRELRANPDARLAKLPALALTAFAGQEDKRRAMSAGFNGYLTKPVRLRDIPVAFRELRPYARAVSPG